MLLGTKLTGNAHKRFHSKLEYLELTTNALLASMESMFHYKINSVPRTLMRAYKYFFKTIAVKQIILLIKFSKKV